MAYDRYDRSNRNDDRYEGRGAGRRSRRPTNDMNYERDDRDFFDRAGDEVRSWFGDDEAERRRELDERYGYAGDGYKNQHFGFERSGRDTNEGYRRPYTGSGRTAGRQSYSNFDDDRFEGRRDRSRFDERQRFEGRGERDYDRNDMYDYDRGYTQDRFGRAQTQSEFSSRDRDYDQWRSRQIDALDRDYDEWRQENQERFDSEFSTWREDRNNKREQLRSLDDGSKVVTSDGETIGTLQSVRGDRMIVKSDSDENMRCVYKVGNLDCIEDGQAKLNLDADDAKRRMRSDDQFDTETSNNRMTNRSFADNY